MSLKYNSLSSISTASNSNEANLQSMQMSTKSGNKCVKTVEYVYDLDLSTMRKLAEELRHDWKDVAYEFEEIFSQYEIDEIESANSPTRIVLEKLRQHGVLLKTLYNVLVKQNLITACEILKDVVSIQPIHEESIAQQNNLPSLCSTQNYYNSNNLENTNLPTTSSPSQQYLTHNQYYNQYANSYQMMNPNSHHHHQQQQSSFFDQHSEIENLKTFLRIHELVLPIIKGTEYIIVEKLNIFNGSFSEIYSKQRKLKYILKKTSSYESIVKELKMIKYRHGNLYTTESILEAADSNSFYLLYPKDSLQVTLQELVFLNPNLKFNGLFKLKITRDITTALSYLHSTDSKEAVYYRKEITMDSILLAITDHEIHAKLHDFSCVEFMIAEDKKLKDEDVYNFGIARCCNLKKHDRVERNLLSSKIHRLNSSPAIINKEIRDSVSDDAKKKFKQACSSFLFCKFDREEASSPDKKMFRNKIFQDCVQLDQEHSIICSYLFCLFYALTSPFALEEKKCLNKTAEKIQQEIENATRN